MSACSESTASRARSWWRRHCRAPPSDPSGEVLISIAVFLSAAGFVNATIIQMPRSFYAMAQDGVLPRAFCG